MGSVTVREGQQWPEGAGHRRPSPTDYLLAAAMFAAGLFVIGIGLVDIYTDTWRLPAHVSPWWHAGPLAVLCALLPARRRFPLTALGVAFAIFLADAALGGSLGALLVLFEFLYSGGLYGARRVVRTLSLMLVVAVPLTAAVTFVLSADVALSVLMALQVFAIFGASFWWGASTRTHVDLLELERRRAEDEARKSAEREQGAVLAERQRMAMDLHDALSGNLAAVTIHAEAAIANPQVSARALETIRVTSKNAMRELQDLLDLLRAPDSQTTAPPTLADLPVLLERTRAQGVSLDVTDRREQREVNTAAGQAAYRIVQESLANAARHSPGTPVRLELGTDGGGLLVQVSSPLPAVAASSAGSGRGLPQMRERAEALGGSLRAGPEGTDWVVRARLPVAEVVA